MKLTGKTRFRRSFFGKYILQVQYQQNYVHDLNGSGYYDESTRFGWRDAKFEDVYQVTLNETVVKSLLGVKDE